MGLPAEWDSPGGLQGRADAILTSSHPSHYAHRMEVVAFATRNGLPNMHAYSQMPPDGALMSYGAGLPYGRTAAIIDRIVKGTPPAEIPVERPTRFLLFINRRAAKEIGLAIPPDVLLRADRVIE